MSSTDDFSAYTARLRRYIGRTGSGASALPQIDEEGEFNCLAQELFRLQYGQNAPFRELCRARGITPEDLRHWSQIPAVPTAAFKELELSCLPEAGRTAVFHSSGTTGQRPSRHFHNAESLALYEASLLPWFIRHLAPELSKGPAGQSAGFRLMILTPPPAAAPHSSLVHMFETVRRALGAPNSAFVGTLGADGAWALANDALVQQLAKACGSNRPAMVLGTAFLFVALLDHLQATGMRLKLPAGSRVLETGGYKGRSRSLPKGELHGFITKYLGIPASHIVCEYGMSELSSQAYDRVIGKNIPTAADALTHHPSRVTAHFRFPPWARVHLISPETGREVAEGEIGLVRVFDLANAFSVLAIQTEDLGVKRGEGFELLGRAALAEPRGCSLMAV